MNDIKTLWKLLPSISRTFAFTIPKLPKELALDLAIAYGVCRVIDTIEDSPIELNQKKIIMERFLVDLNKGESTQSLDTIPTTPNYTELLKKIPVLIRVYHLLPQNIQYQLHNTATEMVKGFSKKEVQEIKTFDDQNIYCYYAAGIVGKLFTQLLYERKYINKYLLKKLHKHSNDFGLALQKVNIIKDIKEDILESRFYWPKELLEKHNLAYSALIQSENAVKVLNEMVIDANKYIDSSLEYINLLPFRPVGIRVFCADILLMATATLAVVNTKEHFNRTIKISRQDVFDIDKKVNELVKKKEQITL